MSKITNNKRIAKNTLFLYFRMFFTMCVNFYVSRVVLQTLGVSDFGLYNVVSGFVVMLSFFNSSMANASQRFLSYDIGREDENELQVTYGLTLTIHALLAVIVLLLAESVGLWFVNYRLNISEEQLFSVNILYQFSVLTSVCGVLSIPFNSLIIAHENMKAFAYLSILEVCLKLVLIFILQIVCENKLIVYGLLVFSISFIIILIYGVYCHFKYAKCKIRFIWITKKIKQMSSFAWWSLFGNFAAVGQNQGVNILLNIFAGTIVNAARGIAFQIQGFIMQFIVNFFTAINPQLIKMFAADEKKEMERLIVRSCRFSFYILWAITLPLIIELPFFLNLWLGDIVPDHTVLFSRLVIINVLVISLSYPLSMSIQATGKIRFYQICVGFLLFLNLPISYVFLKYHYFPEITLYVSLVLEVIALAFRLFILNRLIQFSISFFIKRVLLLVLKVIFCSLLFVFLMLYIFFIVDYNSSVLVFLGAMIITLVVIYFIGLNKREKVFINSQIETLRKKRL